MSVLACTQCGAILSAPGSVRYFEAYDACLTGELDNAVVVADAFTVESLAKCSRCDAAICFYAVDLSSGGLADKPCE